MMGCKAVQFLTVGFEPVFGRGRVRTVLQDQAPKLWSMIHVLAMGHFMGRDIIQNLGWGQNKSPIIRKIA